MKRLVILTLLALFAAPVAAVQPDEMLKDPVLEARARVLSKDLRCVVCQNQSIDDSDAPLARDLRIVVREQLMLGRSDDQILDYVVQRYGQFVLLKPPVEGDTLPLWLGPFAVLGIGGISLFAWGRRRKPAEVTPLTPAEAAEIETLG